MSRVGRRIKLYRDVERFPDFIVRAGATGVVTCDSRYQVAAKMDRHIDGAEYWANEIWWNKDNAECFEADVWHNEMLGGAR